uniref:acid phosphatase n=1 Tax=Ciona savignyi TaxID=51511 RepID=H2ZM93_CIOSA
MFPFNFMSIVLVSQIIFNCVSGEELIFANLLRRHGARSAIHSFKTDPYNNQSIWPQGRGQLTQIGMHQHFDLGRYLKQRYIGLLSPQYNRSEIYIRSTDYDRTLMSAQSNMAGLFPPEGRQQWNGSSTNWQPIPIHTVPRNMDSLLAAPIESCPKLNKLRSDILASTEFAKLQKKYAPFLNNISKWSGCDNVDIRSSWNIQDTLITEKTQGYKLPDWATDEVLKTLDEIAGLDIHVMYSGVNSEYRVDIARVVTGNLMKQIVENMNKRITEEDNFKVVAYSAHDTTVGSLLVALDSYNDLPPPYAACVILELYKDDATSPPRYIVRGYYRNSTKDLIELNLLGCEFNCSLGDFVQRASAIFPTKHSKDCGIPLYTDFFKDHLELLFVIVSCLLALTWILALMACCRRRCRSKKLRLREVAYQPVPSFDEHSSS